MRITFEIDAKDLRQIQKITGQKKKSPAISRALANYLRLLERRALIEKALSGQTDYPLTNEELERRDVYAKLVDSSVWVEFLRRKGATPKVKQIVGRLLQEDQAALHLSNSLSNCWSGVKPGGGKRFGAKPLPSAIISLSSKTIGVARHARLERQWRARGLNAVPRNDLFVATVAIRTGVVILCRDAHFGAAQKVVGEGLRVEQV